MICTDCIYRHTMWETYSPTTQIKTSGSVVMHIYCNNPKSQNYGKEIKRMDECEEKEE